MEIRRSLDARAIALARATRRAAAGPDAALARHDDAAASLRRNPGADGAMAAAQRLVDSELALAVLLDPTGDAFASRV
ncbi:MAG: hypothetical protein AAGH15_28930, partial [Myxococcota bacterium]